VPPSLGFLIPLSTVLQVGSVAAVAGFFFLEKNKERNFWIYAFLAMGAAVFFGKISSTQFMLWPMAFAIPLLGRKEYPLLYAACLALGIISLMNFPFFWHEMEGMTPLGIFLITMRNALLGATRSYVAMGLLKKRAGVGEDMAKPYL